MEISVENIRFSSDKYFALAYCSCICLATLLGYFIEAMLNLRGISYAFFLLGMFSLMLYVLSKRKIKTATAFHNFIAVGSIFLLCSSFPFWSGNHNISLYMAIPVTYTVYLYCFEEMKTAVVCILIISFLVAIYEVVNQRFLFTSVLKGTNIEIYNEENYIFRAKGLMPGPLTLGQLAILATLLFPEKWWIALFALGCALLASSRSGIILITVIFMIRSRKYLSIKSLSVMVACIILALALGGSELIDPRTFERLGNVANFNEDDYGIDTSNITRLYFWMAALFHFENYNLAHKIFGDNGSFFAVEGNNPESGWLSLLIDTGILGSTFYLIIFVTLIVRCLFRRSWICLFETIILLSAMIPFTINLSREGSLLFWLCIYQLIDRTSLEVQHKPQSLTWA